jgi:sigma-B regulation protein RsbU (phosphoserine phosphatase)
MLESTREKRENRMASTLTGLGVPSALSGHAPLPVNLPRFEGLELQGRYHADRCGGDFFDAVATGSRVVFLLTDIAGTRSETLPLIAEVQNEFRTRAQELFEPLDANESEGIAALTRDVNRALIDAAHGVHFAPTFIGCFNLALGILTYHNAGRLLAVFHDAESVRVLDSGGIPLGLFTHSTYEPAILAFQPHARLLLVTKGVAESRRGATEFGTERITRLLVNADTDSASEICEAVLREADHFRNHPWSRLYNFLHPGRQCSHDDLTAVALVRLRQH